MAAEGPSSKKRKVLQPTIKCFMNAKRTATAGTDTPPEEKPRNTSRQRAGPRCHTQKGVFRDQPPIALFMKTDTKAKVDPQNENSKTESEEKVEKTDHEPPQEKPPHQKPPQQKPDDPKNCSKMDQATKLDIKLSPDIILFMKSVCLRHPSTRTQADMTLLKMIIDFNPHLEKADEPLVWLRMQKSLAAMASQLQQEMLELHRQREMAAAQAAQAAAAVRAAAYAADMARRQQLLDQMKRQEAQTAHRREQVAREREMRDRNYNQQLYNAVHNVSASASQMNESQWNGLRQSILAQIAQNDKDSGTLIRFVYKNYPPKGKIRLGEDAIVQILALQWKYDPDSRKKLKMFLLKAIQDYHPDKCLEEHGVKWKTISEDIVKRVTKYYENLK